MLIKKFTLIEIYPDGRKVETRHKGLFNKVNSDIKMYKKLCKEDEVSYELFKDVMIVYH